MPALQLTAHLPSWLSWESSAEHGDLQQSFGVSPGPRPPKRLASFDNVGHSADQPFHASAFLSGAAGQRRAARAQTAEAFFSSVSRGPNSDNQATYSSFVAGPPSQADRQSRTLAMNKPIILLDVDGVLNRYEAGAPVLEEGLIANLARVVKNTSANIVISSQWRKFPDDHMPRLKEALSKAGIESERIIGQTPVFCSAWQCRAREIADFLRSHNELGHAGWVAVDDMDLEKQNFNFMHGHFVKTDSMDGLTSEQADELEHMLQSPGASVVRLPPAAEA